MLRTEARKVRGFNLREWVDSPRRAREDDAECSIGSGTQVFDADTGEHVLTFVPVTERPIGPLLEAARAVPYQENYRTDGLRSRSCTFGFQPRIPIRRDYCSTAALAYTQPKLHATLVEYGRFTAREYERLLPSLYVSQIEMLRGVKVEWKEPDTHFTSGIANDRNTLHYHRDAGNFPGALSTMLSLTRNMGDTGGKLVLPEYRIALEFHGFELLIFNGAKHVHGVTPITVRSADSYRFTVVYYALQSMCKCGTPAEELARIRAKKTAVAKERTSANEAAFKEKLQKISGFKSDEEMKQHGERKKAHFETRKIKVKKP